MKPYPAGSSWPRKAWDTIMARVDAIISWINGPRVR